MVKSKKEPLNIKKIVIIVLIVAVAGLAGFRIIAKLSQGGRRGAGAVYTVGVDTLKKSKVDIILSYQSIIAGDPQVKIYPSVTGKFQQNAVQEGQVVHQGQTLSYINRDIVGSDYLLAPVSAPVAGTVTHLYYIDRGTTITPNNAIAEIANINKIKIVINVGEEDLLQIKKGQTAVIYLMQDTNQRVNGVVDSVTPFVDSDTMTGSVIIKADNPGAKLKMGMSAGIEISTATRNTFMVPESSIIQGLNRASVYIVNNNKAGQVDIQMGYSRNGLTEITSDKLQEGDTFVSVGSFKLFDGATVRTGDSSQGQAQGGGRPNSGSNSSKRSSFTNNANGAGADTNAVMNNVSTNSGFQNKSGRTGSFTNGGTRRNRTNATYNGN